MRFELPVAVSSTDEQSGRFKLVANVNGDKVLRDGALVTILGVPGSSDGLRVSGLSLGGRKVEKWVRPHRLSNLRPKWYHKAKPGDPWTYETREAAQAVVDRISEWLGPEAKDE